MKQPIMLGVAFLAGIAVVGGTYAFVGGEGTNNGNGFGNMDNKASMQAIHENYSDQIEQAVASNDFEAFQAVHDQIKTEMHELRENNAPKMEKRHQQMFEKMVEYYNENGELPDHGAKVGITGKMHGKMMGMKEGHRSFTGKMKGDCQGSEDGDVDSEESN